jgi:putative glycosyltransferase (TIGR04348 family)
MRILLVSPSSPDARTGNEVTANRWTGLLKSLGAEVERRAAWDGETCDLLIALHATRCVDSIERYRTARPEAALVVGLAGTDIYGDLPDDERALAALALADRVVTLQDLAAQQLPEHLRPRARSITQSAQPPPREEPVSDRFECCMLAHLREVKDPLLPARAARLLPSTSRVTIAHAGVPLEADVAAEADRESLDNPRYRWLGPLSADDAAALLCRSRLLVLPSRHEGGANVLSEALAGGIPVLATRIPGNTGLLGEDHPGLFSAGDAPGLAALLTQAETDADFLTELGVRSASLAPRFHPDRERSAWRALLGELGLEIDPADSENRESGD